MVSPWHLRNATCILRAGGIIAYPTEAVFGLGCDPCDPDAVAKLLALKQRSWQKGLILIAASLEQLRPFLLPLNRELENRVSESWPGPVTWLLPAAPSTPWWITGEHNTIAVRVSDHPVVVDLCNEFGGAIVSTSANLAGQPPDRSVLKLQKHFGNRIDYLIHGELGGLDRPSEIRDGVSGEVLRSG